MPCPCGRPAVAWVQLPALKPAAAPPRTAHGPQALQPHAEAGAPWHAQDAEGYTAGEYASGSGHRHIVDLLLDWAVRAELILGGWPRRWLVRGYF